MREAVIDWVEALPLPGPVLVVLLAALPIIELRGAIPAARAIFEMPAVTAYGWAVVGNMLPVPVILWLLAPFMRWTEQHWEWLHRFLSRLHASTERRHHRRFERLRDLALITFVAVPLPITGAWTGSLAAVVFDVPRRKAIGLIFVGVLVAGLVVTLFLEALGLALA